MVAANFTGFAKIQYSFGYKTEPCGQSAYRAYHSTETAPLRVHHDIAYSLDSNCCAVLLMLDLSAAFDTIDHQILLIQYSFGPKTEPCDTPKRSLISSDCTAPIATL
jgi:hypothetical protein